MTRLRALLWALAPLAVAYPTVTAPVLDTVGHAVRWLAGEPTLLLTAAALVLLVRALSPRRTATGSGAS